jgi:hypothetical protein
MAEFIWTTVLPGIGTIALGALGWLAANFFGEPLLRFWRVRREIHESLIFTAAISDASLPGASGAAVVELRRHSARLTALWVAASPTVQRWWKSRAYNLPVAASGLIGLSNSLSDVSGNRAVFTYQVQNGLRLPLDYTEDQIRAIRERKNLKWTK